MSDLAPLSCIVYDLDGTLIDSATDIAHAVNRVRESLALEALDEETIRRFIGDGAGTLLDRAVFGIVDDPADRPERTLPKSAVDPRELYDRFVGIYEEAPVMHTSLVEGAERAIRRWRSEGIAQAVLTNKPHGIALNVLEQLGLLELFDCVMGRGLHEDGKPLPAKPDPASLDWILDQVGAEKDETWMVGDGPADVELARNSGIPCVTIVGGYSTIEKLSKAGCDLDLCVADFAGANQLLETRTRVAI